MLITITGPQMNQAPTLTQARIRRKKVEDGGSLPEFAGRSEKFPGNRR